jgi:hypothetical protein
VDGVEPFFEIFLDGLQSLEERLVGPAEEADALQEIVNGDRRWPAKTDWGRARLGKKEGGVDR